jgi:hypothetical protein
MLCYYRSLSDVIIVSLCLFLVLNLRFSSTHIRRLVTLEGCLSASPHRRPMFLNAHRPLLYSLNPTVHSNDERRALPAKGAPNLNPSHMFQSVEYPDGGASVEV